MRTRSVFSIKVLKDLPGFLSFKISGEKAKIFKKESGGVRWQRVPPTEKKGRVHTSSVTVAVLDDNDTTSFELNENDLTYRAYKASGKGGQHRNKRDSAIEVTHVPTGITAKCDSERSQHDNKRLARELLEYKLQQIHDEKCHSDRSAKRKKQVGTGLRGDKIKTVQEQNGQVVNHQNGKKVSLKKYFKGRIDLLHD